MHKWAHNFVRQRNRRLRKIQRTHLFGVDPEGSIVVLRRKTGKGKKKNFFEKVIQYGVEVPRNVRHALRLDQENGNTFWQDAIKKEVDALRELSCF